MHIFCQKLTTALCNQKLSRWSEYAFIVAFTSVVLFYISFGDSNRVMNSCRWNQYIYSMSTCNDRHQYLAIRKTQLSVSFYEIKSVGQLPRNNCLLKIPDILLAITDVIVGIFLMRFVVKWAEHVSHSHICILKFLNLYNI